MQRLMKGILVSSNSTPSSVRGEDVTPARFELAIYWMKTSYPRPLDDGAA